MTPRQCKSAPLDVATRTTQKRSRGRVWIGRIFLLWAAVSTLWLADTYRTRGVSSDLLRSQGTTSVTESSESLNFLPTESSKAAALIFFCGSGVSSHAYAPLLRPVADSGYAVYIIKLPYRFAPLEAHKDAAVARARNVIASHPQYSRWVVAGHSLGGALTCRMAESFHPAIAGFVLIGTTHPKQHKLTHVAVQLTKVYASSDGVAPRNRVRAGSKLLPPHTNWVEIVGGNHSQFGHYGHQLLDGYATISRESQQDMTRAVLLESLAEAEH